MIIALGRYGQLCNRLFSYANLYAFELEYGIPIQPLGFSDYATAFPKVAPRCHRFRWSYAMHQKLYALVRRTCPRRHWTIPETEAVHLEVPENISLMRKLSKRYPSYLHGFYFLENDAFIKHADVIRTQFAPQQQLLDAVQSRLFTLRNDSPIRPEVLIGVHIRLGDYRQFCNGAFYFDWETYRTALQHCIELFSPQKVIFVLVSNESIPKDAFMGVNAQWIQGSAEQDLYTLANCDYIIGPPSTYSQWASFYGKVPRFFMEKNKTNPHSPQDFIVHRCGFGRFS